MPARRGSRPTFDDGALIAGRYKVVRFIAKGGMGEVYEVEDTALRGRVALKTILPEIAADPTSLERFKREIHLARKITHANVSRIYDLGSHADPSRPEEAAVLFLTMELLGGASLAEEVERMGRLSTTEALPLVSQIAAGLDAAHQAGVIHRDFKSANVMLAPTNGGQRAVVTDFGLARTGGASESVASISESGIVVGTPAYMAPEQVEGRTLTPAADLYAFGTVLFEMVTGRRPFEGESAMSVAVARLTSSPPSPREFVPDLDPVWEAVILRCLARKPEDRFASALEVLAALSGAAFVAPKTASLVIDGTQSLKLPTQRLPSEMAATAQPLQLPPSSPTLVERLRSRRAGVPVAAAATVCLVVGVWAISRWRAQPAGGEPPGAAPTPVAMRRSLGVFGLKNVTSLPRAAWISTAVSEMLTTDLAAGGIVRTVSGQDVARVRADLGLTESEGYSREQLGRIRANLGVDFVVVGSYTLLDEAGGGLLRVDLRLQDARSGEVVESGSASGTEGQLFDLTSRAGAPLRQKLGLPALAPGQVQEVAAILPKGREAAQLYVEGLARLRASDAKGASELLTKAAGLEPNHPLPHAGLAAAWQALGYEARAIESARTAAGLASSLPRDERLSVEARLSEASRAWPKAIEATRTLFDAAPDNVEYGLRLAEAQIADGKAREALATTEKLRKLPAPASDDPRIDVTEARAYHRMSQPKQSQALASRAAQKATAQGAQSLLGEALLLQATASSKLGEGKLAVELNDRARAAFEATGDRSGQARALERLALSLYATGDLDGSRRIFERALAAHRELGNRTAEARFQLNFGNVLFGQGKLAEAREKYDGALRAFREAGLRTEIARTLNSIGACLFQMGDLAAAARHYKQAFDLYSEIGAKAGIAEALTNLGEIAYLRGDLAQSQEMHQEALAADRETGDKGTQAYDLYRLGDVFYAKGDLRVAEERYKEALALQSGLGDSVAAADTKVGLARAAVAAGRAKEAETLAREAEEVLRTQEALDRAAFARLALTDALVALDRLDDARTEAQAARDRSKQSQDPKLRAAAQVVAARVQALSRKPDDLAAAARDLGAVVAECGKAGFVPCQLEARLALGDVERLAGKKAEAAARLKAVAAEASAKGFGLIARRASASS